MFEYLDKQATQTGFGDLVGVSQQAISKLVAKGVIPQAGTYRQLLIVYVDHLRQVASGREEEARLTAARIREAEANADLKELQFVERLGAVVEVDAIAPALAGWAVRARTAIVAAGDRIRDAIESKHGIEIEDGIITEPLRAALEDVADYPTDLGGFAAEDRERAAPS